MAKRSRSVQPQGAPTPVSNVGPELLKIFISWSGERSKAVAEALKSWLSAIFQDVEPWISTHDIGAGQRWSTAVAEQLEGCNFGIVCLSPENIAAPWILFEAGALSKSVESGRVVPYLFGLKAVDVAPPLGQFQCVPADEDGTRALVGDINGARKVPADEERLRELFEGMWPVLKRKLDAVPPTAERAERARNEREILEEVVTSIRGIQSILEMRPGDRPNVSLYESLKYFFPANQTPPEDARLMSAVEAFSRYESLSDRERGLAALQLHRLVFILKNASPGLKNTAARLAVEINESISDPAHKLSLKDIKRALASAAITEPIPEF